MNELNIISPYKTHGLWVFDDTTKGLDQEPPIEGTDTFLDMMTKDYPEEKCVNYNLIVI